MAGRSGHVPSRADRIFAALQGGPVLGVSSAVLHRGGRFTAELLVPTGWRTARALSHHDARSALLGATLCRAASLLPVGPCERCGPAVELLPGAAAEGRDEGATPQGLDSYAATLVPRCSSSRRHLHCEELALEVRLGLGVVVRSPEFVICARRARGGPQQAPEAPQAAGALVVAQPSVSASPSDAVALPSPTTQVALLGAGRMVAGGMRLIVTVKIVSNGESPRRIADVVDLAVRYIQQNVSGLLVHKTGINGSLLFCIAGYTSEQAASKGAEVGHLVTTNKVPNTMGRDLYADGTIAVLSVTNSW
eukprot:m51a1_g2436 hypothetical protein (307) ;mRNA; f:850398-851377